jgi:hypothetical protein
MQNLTDNQRQALDALRANGPWPTEGYEWVWDCRSEMIWQSDRLVAKGYATREIKGGVTVYTATDKPVQMGEAQYRDPKPVHRIGEGDKPRRRTAPAPAPAPAAPKAPKKGKKLTPAAAQDLAEQDTERQRAAEDGLEHYRVKPTFVDRMRGLGDLREDAIVRTGTRWVEIAITAEEREALVAAAAEQGPSGKAFIKAVSQQQAA